jgi:hypothetical protein
MIFDVEFFKSKLAKFSGANELGDQLIQVIKNKSIDVRPQPPPSRDSQSHTQPTPAGTTQGNEGAG